MSSILNPSHINISEFQEIQKNSYETNNLQTIENTQNNQNTQNTENIFINIVEHLYNYIKSIHTEKITPSNIVIITTEMIQIVEKYKSLTGYQKKNIVISVIKKIINNQVDTIEDKKAINLIIDITLPTIIDNLISAINGDYKFNKDKIKSFFKKYFVCCK